MKVYGEWTSINEIQCSYHIVYALYIPKKLFQRGVVEPLNVDLAILIEWMAILFTKNESLVKCIYNSRPEVELAVDITIGRKLIYCINLMAQWTSTSFHLTILFICWLCRHIYIWSILFFLMASFKALLHQDQGISSCKLVLSWKFHIYLTLYMPFRLLREVRT